MSHNYVDEPLRMVFPGMKSGHDTYKDARKRVQRSYKTWKGERLKWALAWVQRWMKSAQSLRRREFLEGLSTFAELKSEIRKDYDFKWLEGVFRFGLEAVDGRCNIEFHRERRYSTYQTLLFEVRFPKTSSGKGPCWITRSKIGEDFNIQSTLDFGCMYVNGRQPKPSSCNRVTGPETKLRRRARRFRSRSNLSRTRSIRNLQSPFLGKI